jgi:hypothetical protein
MANSILQELFNNNDDDDDFNRPSLWRWSDAGLVPHLAMMVLSTFLCWALVILIEADLSRVFRKSNPRSSTQPQV